MSSFCSECQISDWSCFTFVKQIVLLLNLLQQACVDHIIIPIYKHYKNENVKLLLWLLASTKADTNDLKLNEESKHKWDVLYFIFMIYNTL